MILIVSRVAELQNRGGAIVEGNKVALHRLDKRVCPVE